ncbi:MAG: biotin--[acetyl-CoA-carboxylase] ligase [Litoreibacter sp.]
MSIKLPQGYDLIHLEEVDSTMSEAARRAPSLSRATWILADRQTQSRGRRGRAWRNFEGNFAATLILKPQCSAQQAAQRSFVAAVALYFALRDLPGVTGLELKWPNDVLLQGQKVAGILLESTSKNADIVEWVTVGIGVNLVSAPDIRDLEDRAIAPISIVDAGGVAIPTTAFLEILAEHFAYWETQLTHFGFDTVRKSWLDHAARVGKKITARTSSETLYGVFETIDADGNMILNTNGTQRSIAAADVYF